MKTTKPCVMADNVLHVDFRRKKDDFTVVISLQGGSITALWPSRVSIDDVLDLLEEAAECLLEVEEGGEDGRQD